MKLAEALMIRAELKKEIDILLDKIIESAVLHDDEEKLEDPNEYLLKLNNHLNELFLTEKKILKTNFESSFDEKRTIYEALLEKQHLARILHRYERLIDSVKKKLKPFYYYEDIKKYEKPECLIDIKKLIFEKEQFENSYKKLNQQIQKRNWEIDVLE